MKGMTTCNVCGRDFPLLIEDHYVSRESKKIGLAALAGGDEEIMYDTFDCPRCGCQNRLQKRTRSVYRIEDAPVCPFPKGGECYCKDLCSEECEFHPDYKGEDPDGVQ